MKLTIDQIRTIATGAEQIAQDGGSIRLFRFNEGQQVLYSQRAALGLRSRSTAGIKLQFETDSRTLKLSVYAQPGSTRTYFAFDVWVNGKMLGSVDNFSEQALPAVYADVQLPLGERSGSFDLGEGDKQVCIYFPWSVDGQLNEICLDEGAKITPLKRSKTLLAFGDSITQGYDALHPSGTYLAQLARKLDADEWNKAVGGEHFLPELSAIPEAVQPDILLVAYGTNDWSGVPEETFMDTSRRFFLNLQKQFPNVPMLVLTPIWRADADQVFRCGTFDRAEALIRQAVRDMPQARVIPGINLVPHDGAFYADERVLHPNDDGFREYANNIKL